MSQIDYNQKILEQLHAFQEIVDEYDTLTQDIEFNQEFLSEMTLVFKRWIHTLYDIYKTEKRLIELLSVVEKVTKNTSEVH